MTTRPQVVPRQQEALAVLEVPQPAAPPQTPRLKCPPVRQNDGRELLPIPALSPPPQGQELQVLQRPVSDEVAVVGREAFAVSQEDTPHQHILQQALAAQEVPQVVVDPQVLAVSTREA